MLATVVVPEEATIATRTARDPTSFNNNSAAVPGIKAKLQLDDNYSSLQAESASPMQRIRQQKHDNHDLDAVDDEEEEAEGSATPSSPSRRSQGEVVESWKRKMKLAQKKREQEANELNGGGGGGGDDTIATNDEETDNDIKADGEASFIRAEDDIVFKEEDDDNCQIMMRACQPSRKEDGNMLDPIFSAAMTFWNTFPCSSRKELFGFGDWQVSGHDWSRRTIVHLVGRNGGRME
mmetsp:Transcript_14989/g.36561  ORF Transcript_14989/g.36561 Transcript_14989/m.36561 type:complete len:236 (+) Transcript_14989:33-740(+)